MADSRINEKSAWNIEEIEIPLPNNHEEVFIAADSLFAELLIGFYIKKKEVDNKENYGKLSI